MQCDPTSHWLNETCLFCAASNDGREAGRVASELAHMAADPEWAEKAWAWIVRKAEAGEMFTADNLVEAVGMPDAHRNAVGGLIRRASTSKLIQSVGTTQSTRKETHGRLVRVWLGAAWVS